ncbi:hypothetical protein NMY233_0510 [Neisseria meningitidis NM233]|nr:hypothetical protein NMY233_0510 [Neisseria meningitidis NM233]
MQLLAAEGIHQHQLRPLQNSFPSRQPKSQHRFSAVFAPNTA